MRKRLAKKVLGNTERYPVEQKIKAHIRLGWHEGWEIMREGYRKKFKRLMRSAT